MQILIAILGGTKRFKEIAGEIEGISDCMLCKELKELESHELVERKIQNSFPPVVVQSTTHQTHSLDMVIVTLKEWGHFHREKMIGHSK